MRLIDADDFRYRMYHESFERGSEEQRWDSGCWIRYRMFERVLDHQPTAKQWIPCSERLPEDFQSFYATCRSNVDVRENWVIEGCYTPWRGFDPPPLVAEGKAEIIAWMPKELPEPYKEDDHEID